MSEELIYKVGVEGTNELNKLEQSVDKAGKSVGKTKLYMSELRTELRKARGDMIKYAEGTEEYNRALARGSKITSQINDANAKMRIGVQDLGDTTKNVTSTMVGFAGGFQVVQSAMSLFGIENEETIKTVLKLQQTMAIVQGMAAFAQGINDVQNLIAGFRASSAQLNEELKATSDGMEGVAGSSGKMGDAMGVSAKESAVLGSNLAGQTAIADGVANSNKNLTDSFKNLEKSVNSNKTEVNILGNSYDRLYKNQDILTDSLKDYEEQLTNLWSIETPTEDEIEQIKKLELEYENLEKAYTTNRLELIKTGELHTKKTKELRKETESLEELGKATEGQTEATKKLGKANKAAGKGISSFAKTIGKSLATMGAFLAIIWVVTEAISWLIKEMAKIDEKVKIDIEIKETVSQQIAKDQIAVRRFVNDYKKAWRENDTDRLEGMAKIAKEEYNMSEERLKLITDTEDGWREAFKEYLEIAEKTYRAEALIKMRVDAELKKETELFAAEEKFMYKTGKTRDKDTGKADLSGTVRSGLEVLDWEKMKDIAEEGGISGKMWDIFDLWGVPQEIVDHLRAVNAANEILNNLPEINYDDLDFDTGRKTKTTTTDVKTPAGKAPSLQDRRPDAVEDDMVVEYGRSRNALVKELSNEELVIYEEAKRKYDVLQDDSEIKYSEYQVRLAKARGIDLNNQKEYIEETLAKTIDYYSEELNINNKNLADKTNAHNEELAKLREYNQKKFDIEAKTQALLEERQDLDGKKDADKIKAIDSEIKALNGLYKVNNDNISQSKDLIAKHKEEISIIEEKLKVLDNTPEEIARMRDEITQLNLAIADNSALLVDSMARNTQAMMEQATLYLDTMSSTFSGIADMNAGFMQAEDNKTAKLKNNLELSQKYREADAEQQAQMMYELELANYEAKKKTFETNKNFEIGSVVATSAANQMDIIKAWLDPKTGGPLSPVNIAVAAAATLANVTTMIGSIAQISSTSLDEPIPPGGVAGGSAPGGANIALSPNKSSLTSKEENLNMMYQSGKGKPNENIVKVSDINNIQKKVSVREKNSSY